MSRLSDANACLNDPNLELNLPGGPNGYLLLELENDALSSVYDMAGDDKERMVYDVGIYT